MKRVWMFAAVAVAALFCGGVDLKSALKQDKKAPERESVITADKIEFDNKEGVILLDNNVLVDDERFVLRSKRLLVFLDGTNDVKQILAVGNVVITNENRIASCDKAVYTKENGQVVMTGNARLLNGGNRGGEVRGERITFWLDDERMEVSAGSKVVLPPGTFRKAGDIGALGEGKKHGKNEGGDHPDKEKPKGDGGDRPEKETPKE